MADGRPFDGRSLVAVFAHPDDESITCGGLLAACAARGAHVVVLCLTRGEGGPSAGVDSPEALAARRTAELDAAARILGVNAELADFQDGMLPWTEAAAVEARIAAVLARVRPDVVVTFGADGLYWHPDHIAVHDRVAAVVAAMGEGAPALYGATCPPGAMRVLFDRACARASASGQPPPRQILGITAPDAFGSEAAAPTLILDVRDHAARKLAALRCHATQLSEDALSWLTPEDAVLLATEHLHRLGPRAGFIERLAS